MNNETHYVRIKVKERSFCLFSSILITLGCGYLHTISRLKKKNQVTVTISLHKKQFVDTDTVFYTSHQDLSILHFS